MLKQIADLESGNDKLSSERDRWKGIAKRKPWWLPELTDERNIFGAGYGRPPRRNSMTGWFPPRVFEQARSKRDDHPRQPVGVLKIAETDMKAREDGVMRGVQVLLNDGAAAVGYSPALAPSNTALQTSAHPSHQASSVQDTGLSTQANIPAGPVVNPADVGKASISAEQSKEGERDRAQYWRAAPILRG